MKGVSGCGKSTLGQNLADALKIPFYDGDSLHPQSNIDKMSRGIALTDADREPWLALIRSTADRICENKERDPSSAPEGLDEVNGVVIACSALKKRYRDILRGKSEKSHKPPSADDLPKDHPITEHTGIEISSQEDLKKEEQQELERAASKELRTFFVFMRGTKEVLEDRMKKRQNHFMKVDMLNSQLNTLEDPTGEEGVVVVNLEEPAKKQVIDAVDGLGKVGFIEQHTKPAGSFDESLGRTTVVVNNGQVVDESLGRTTVVINNGESVDESRGRTTVIINNGEIVEEARALRALSINEGMSINESLGRTTVVVNNGRSLNDNLGRTTVVVNNGRSVAETLARTTVSINGGESFDASRGRTTVVIGNGNTVAVTTDNPDLAEISLPSTSQ